MIPTICILALGTAIQGFNLSQCKIGDMLSDIRIIGVVPKLHRESTRHSNYEYPDPHTTGAVSEHFSGKISSSCQTITAPSFCDSILAFKIKVNTN